MPKKQLTKTSKLLLYLFAAEEVAAQIFEPIHKNKYRVLEGRPFEYRSCLYKLIQRGIIAVSYKEDKKLYALSDAGVIEALMAKATLPKKCASWDGKWSLIVFDVPEVSKQTREVLRKLLKTNGFKALQQSVYINPHPIHQDAIEYLQKSGLINFIRILRVDRIDNDQDVRKLFNI